MTVTPHLALPLLAAAQAQKHVTHNEALALVDALTHLSVASAATGAPPNAPQEGERHLVASGAGGAFAGHDGQIALFDAGVWRFLVPRAGWVAHVAGSHSLLVHDGAAWRDLGESLRLFSNLDGVGIGTAPDPVNALALKGPAALFTARPPAEGGSGDLRVAFSKQAPGGTASHVWQAAYEGRAEAGLIGDDDFRIRVSADGALWRDALRIDRATGEAHFPAGAPALSGGAFRNLLINPTFVIDQRGFGGGALAAGVYGFDRWRGGPGGATLTRSTDGTVTLLGSIEQVIERPELAGEWVTVSLDAPSGDVAVGLGDGAGMTSGVIPAGTGRRSVTLAVPPGATGHVTLRLSSGTLVSFRRPQAEANHVASAFERRPIFVEESLCRRYCHAIAPILINSPLGVTASNGSNAAQVFIALPMTMRAAPAVSVSEAAHFGVYMDAGAGFTGHPVTEIYFAGSSPSSVRLICLHAGSAPSGVAGQFFSDHAAARLLFTAEL